MTMKKYKNVGLILGFSLLVFGFTAIILQMVGVHWYFLSWLELGGRLFAFVAKVLMVLVGMVLFIIARTDWDRERRESM